MIVPSDYSVGEHQSNTCNLSRYLQEDAIMSDESEIYLFFVTQYDSLVTILIQ